MCVYDKISFLSRFSIVCRTISTFGCKISLHKSKQVELIKVDQNKDNALSGFPQTARFILLC